MFDTIFKLFNKEKSFEGIRRAAGLVEDLVELFEEEYLKDKNTKNAAIDAVIQMLEEHKDK
jgi:hypothetical protein